MYTKLSSTAIEAFRSTLRMVEQQCGLAPEDPALLELKRILLSRIAQLEAAHIDADQNGRLPETIAAEVDAIPDVAGSQITES